MVIFSGLKQRIFQFVPDTSGQLFYNFSNQAHPSMLEKHQESLENCIFGQIFISSLIFGPFPIFGLSSKFYCIPPIRSLSKLR